jgi:hypothetical protein
LRRALSAIAFTGDGWIDWRAMCLLVCTQVGLILSLLGISSIVLKRNLIPTHGLGLTFFIVALPAAVAGLNYYCVQYKGRWKQFEKEFDSYSELRKTVGCVIMIILPLLTAVTMSWTAAAMVRLSH